MQYQVLFKHLCNKNAWDSDNLSALQNEANTFPYFGCLHFFLLKETGKGDDSYASIAGKLALHFNNPYHLHLKIHQNDKETNNENQVKIAGDLVGLETTAEILLTKPNLERPASTEKPSEKDELIFEPLFTSDYFASQGIKLSEEIKANDKLGNQLKTFTAWLKTIKSTNGNRLPETAVIDKKVEQLAEKSNEGDEILTESMGEVYMQQGKYEQAEEIFKKLSLLYPAKSIYFANKFESLKDK
jgi:tetratricopeptide (TPR) repeat protein